MLIMLKGYSQYKTADLSKITDYANSSISVHTIGQFAGSPARLLIVDYVMIFTLRYFLEYSCQLMYCLHYLPFRINKPIAEVWLRD